MNAKKIVLVICAIVAVAVVAGGYLCWGVSGKFSGLKSEDLRNLIFLVGGLTAGIIAAWRAQVADKQTQINEQSQITERFTRAVDQLGSENLYMRIGALHALERIGRDSENDVVAILRLLSNFVRSQSSSQKTSHILHGGDAPAPLDAVEGLAVIIRLAGKYEQLLRNEERSIVNLHASYLPHLTDFGGMSFFRFDFTRCNLSQGFFLGSNFEGADFLRAHLNNAWLEHCNFRHTQFDKAILDGAHFGGADMTEAILWSAVCNGTDFSAAKNLTTEMLKNIIYDAKTPPKVPEGVDLPPPTRSKAIPDNNPGTA